MAVEQISNGLGTFHYEGAVGLSSMLVSEKLSNARGLCARQWRNG